MFAGKKLKFVSIVTLFFFTWFCFAADFSFAQANKEDPLLKAKRLSQEGDYDGAIKILQDYIEKIKLIKKEKQNLVKAYYSLARTFYKVGEEELCDKNLRMVYEINPNFNTEENDLIFKDRTEKIKKKVEERLLEEKREEAKTKEEAKKVEVKKEKKPIVKEEIPKKEPVKKVVTKPAKKKKKNKKFPVLLVIGGVVAIGIILFLVLKKKTKEYNLTVNTGVGVQGTPSNGTYTYKKGEVVNYNYSTESGYIYLKVLLDGNPISPSGSITIDSDHRIVATSSGDPNYDVNGLKIEWIQIPAGEFKMGDNFNEGDSDELPVHSVYLDTYYISKYEITYDQYDKFCDETGRKKPDDWDGRGKKPVTHVTWDDARDFCAWLSQITGKNIHLPTEAQWEKAARGTDQRRYPWGNEHPTCILANYTSDCGRGSKTVGSHPLGVSPYGVHDMAGNVWEWCSDWYSSSYYSISPKKNPTGPSTGNYRVERGGSTRGIVRAANRGAHRTRAKDFVRGFRPVWD